MTTKSKRPRYFLDTSAVLYQRHGHSLQRAAVRDAVGDGVVLVSMFIRMEYLRGVILNLIELYFLIKESESVDDALIDWSQKIHQDRKLKIVLMTVPRWIVQHEDWQAREKSLRRLGELIVRWTYEFDEAHRGRHAKDRLACELGRVSVRRQTFQEQMLLDFYLRFRSIQDSIPNCRLCEFKERQQRTLIKLEIDLYSPAQRNAYAKYKGYVTQAERMEEAAHSTETVPRCRWCERLGDSIIMLQTPKTATVVTADRAFVPLGEILGRPVRLLPSLAELKKQLPPPANSAS
jgi:hypothetical protein